MVTSKRGHFFIGKAGVERVRVCEWKADKRDREPRIADLRKLREQRVNYVY